MVPLTAFQLIVTPSLIAIAIATIVATARRRLTPGVGVFWIVLWLAAAVAVADPDMVQRAGRFLGIGRGADLVLYLSILFMFVAFFVIYLRFRRIEDQLTRIVRHLAIEEAKRTAGPEKREDA